jgi:hypothetical protein
MATEQERREERCGASVERLDALCRHFFPAHAKRATASLFERKWVAFRRSPAALRASTVAPATLFGARLADQLAGKAMTAGEMVRNAG